MSVKSFIPSFVRDFFSNLYSTNKPPTSDDSSIDSSVLASNGWLQGKILKKQFADLLTQIVSLPSSNENDIWIVVSQSCDLLNNSFENEPYAEVVKATLIEREVAKTLVFNKNPRMLECEEAFQGEGSQSIRLSIHDRVLIKRSLLANSEPVNNLELKQETIRIITRWISNRYIRPAFPDEFNTRAKRELDKIGTKSSFRKAAIKITGIWLNTEDQELRKDEEYKVVIIATMKTNDFNNEEFKNEAFKAIDKFEAALSKCVGIEVEESKLLPESKFTIEDYHNSKHWDFDYLSIRDGDDAPLG